MNDKFLSTFMVTVPDLGLSFLTVCAENEGDKL